MNTARQAFWDELNEMIASRPNTPLQETTRVDTENDNWRPQRHLADSVSYCFNLRIRDGEIMVYLLPRRTRDREAILDHLHSHHDTIAGTFEETLEWRPSDGKYKLILRRSAELEARRDAWPEYQEWLIERVETLYFTTGPYLAGFDAT